MRSARDNFQLKPQRPTALQMHSGLRQAPRGKPGRLASTLFRAGFPAFLKDYLLPALRRPRFLHHIHCELTTSVLSFVVSLPSMYICAAIAASAPSPALIIACLVKECLQSPAAKIPGLEVCMFSSVIM